MTKRSKWLGFVVSLGVILSMALVTLVTNVSAAAPSQKSQASKAKAGSTTRCAKQLPTKGTIKIADWEFASDLNTFTNTEAAAAWVANGMFDSLFLYDQHAKMIPQMATSVPSFKNGLVKDGGKTITIRLKKGLRWSNGTEITSQDFKFGLQVGMNKLSGPACLQACDVIARMDTPDKYTMVFHLKHIYGPFLAYGLPPLLPHKWSNAVGSWTTPAQAAQIVYQTPTYNFENDTYPTNGPYKVSEFVKDDRIVLTPMKYYNDMSCGARLSNLIFVGYSSKPGLIAAAQAGQVDVTGGGGGYTAADIAPLKKDTSHYKLYTDPGFIYEHLEMNHDATFNGKPNPLASAKVRDALALALDKVGLVQSALSISAAAAKKIVGYSPWINAPGLVQPFADKNIKGQWDPITHTYQSTTGNGKALADAKTLLAQTPYKGGFDLQFYTNTGNPVRSAQAAIIQSNWKRLGVNVILNFVSTSSLFGDYAHNGIYSRGNFQVGMFGWQGSPDPDQIKGLITSKFIDRLAANHSASFQNYSAIKNPKIDQLMKAAGATFDNKVRAKDYAQVQELLNKNADWIVLYYRPAIATATARVKNFLNNPTQLGPTWNVYAWAV